MKFQLSLYDIKQAYYGLKQLAIKAFHLGDLKTALFYLHHCSVIAQQFNWIYADNDIEQLLEQIGKAIIGEKRNNLKTNPNRVVFVDDFCVSFVLAIQYIDALVASGKEILYITTIPQKSCKYSDILSLIGAKKQVKVKWIPLTEENRIENLNKFYEAIIDYAPSQILLHLLPSSCTIPALYALPENIKTYLINLADQTFWLGAGAIDYCIEFRPFGVAVSRERRGIKPEQQLMLPFYPVVDKNPFQGFPQQCSEPGKVTIFSGGDIYKVLDDKRMYWHLVKKILDTFPEIVFVFAAKGDRLGMQFLNSFINDNHFENRFIYTKFRPDIDEVLAHADIYMGTCPASGSLMSQIAARNATPILQYYYPGTPDDETEQSLCINDKFQISYQNEEEFMQEADRLIRDVEYRKAKGERLKRAMIQPEQFNKALERMLSTHESPFPVETKYVDYKLLDDRWFALEKAGYIDSMPYLCSLLGKKNCLRYVPILYLKKNINRILNHFK